MTSISTPAKKANQQRRYRQRRQQVKALQVLWRIVVVSGLSGGLVWGLTRPFWLLQQPNQVVIEGNHLLKAQAIRALLPLTYPKYLLRVDPKILEQSLKAQPDIANAIVTRELFPPKLTVQVQERVPVANALILSGSSSAATKVSVGLLDETGVLIPLSTYRAMAIHPELPQLEVIGVPEQYRSYWPQLYQAVIHSPVKISQIDCRDPGNLIFKTQLGFVHLGPYSSQLAEQLNVLAQMRQLPTKVPAGQLAYINLANPKSPSVQTNQLDNWDQSNKPEPTVSNAR